MFDTKYTLDILCMVSLVIMLVIQIHRVRKEEEKVLGRVFLTLMISLMVIIALDFTKTILNKKQFGGDVVLSYVINTVYMALLSVYSWFWLSFMTYYVLKKRVSFIKIAAFTVVIAIAEIVLLILNVNNQWIFFITEENAYIRGKFYSHNLVMFYLYLFSTLGVTIVGSVVTKDFYHRKKCLLLIVYSLMPIAGIISESLSSEAALLLPFFVMALGMIYVSEKHEEVTELQIMESEERERRVGLENKLVHQNVRIMLSQIQPHFLYNVLTTIAQLCDIDPKTAKGAVIDFSKYLRANIDSVQDKTIISFDDELEHIKRYLNLEKIRYEDDLKVVFDIQATSFYVPALSILPLVENAVQDGVCQNEDGGTVIIATRADDDCYKIIIKDDGPGFDVDKKLDNDEDHIGINGAKSRLNALVDGTIKIESRKNAGTTVTITVPKGE